MIGTSIAPVVGGEFVRRCRSANDVPLSFVAQSLMRKVFPLSNPGHAGNLKLIVQMAKLNETYCAPDGGIVNETKTSDFAGTFSIIVVGLERNEEILKNPNWESRTISQVTLSVGEGELTCAWILKTNSCSKWSEIRLPDVVENILLFLG